MYAKSGFLNKIVRKKCDKFFEKMKKKISELLPPYRVKALVSQHVSKGNNLFNYR